ncbi:hypothetical protein [Dialister succinatiphilus]|uniref:hypothetical protein n=1 Tax=Dialister succinatiphilus TaxID=487173 RepID=UPI003F7F4475
MSKWTDVRDSVIDALNLDDVTDQVKVDLTTQIVNNGMPAIEDVADAFVTKIQAQASAETGWNKVRDQVVLPLLIKGAIYFVKTVLAKTIQTESESTTEEQKA